MPLDNDTSHLEKAGHQVFYWHLELSSKCALKCPRCPRTEYPGRYKVTEMTVDFIQKILPPKRLSHVKKILICGGQGDAIYCNDFLKIINYFKTTKSDLPLCITTNGSYKKKEWWKKTAQILNGKDSVIFSIDGWDQKSNAKYRVGSHFPSIMEGLKTLRKFNPKVSIVWSTIIFKFNEKKLNDIRQLAKDAGADFFNVVQSRVFGSINMDYIDPQLGYDPLEPSGNFVETSNTNRGLYIKLTKDATFGVDIKKWLFQLMEKYKNTYKDSYIIPLCRIGERGLYVDAEGTLYPCSWISHPFANQNSKKRKKSITWEKSLFVEHKDSFNLNKHSLEDIIQNPLWKKLQCSWLSFEKAFVECEKHCHRPDSLKKLAVIRSHYSKTQSEHTLKVIEDYRKNIKKRLMRF